LVPLDSPQLADFIAALDEVNAAGERAPGFRWRLQTEDGNATSIRAFEWDGGDSHGVIVNLTTWDGDRRAPTTARWLRRRPSRTTGVGSAEDDAARPSTDAPDWSIFAAGNADGTVVLRDVATREQVGPPLITASNEPVSILLSTAGTSSSLPAMAGFGVGT
jgi:hypothetical protein